MVDQITTAEWRAVLLHLTATTATEQRAAADLLRDACGSDTRALAVLAEVRRLEAVTTVPAVDIAFAGTKPPPAVDADPPGRLRPVVPISTRDARHASHVDARPGPSTRPAGQLRCSRSPQAVERPGARARCNGLRPIIDLVSGWALMLGALAVPVLVAYGLWKGSL